MTDFKTEQEHFWAGEFGDAYAARNQGANWVASNIALFSRILIRTVTVKSVIEFGANIGMNIVAMKQLLPEAAFSAVEINEKAAEHLRAIPDLTVYRKSLLEFVPDQKRDFVLVKGVLIHMNPETLPSIYDLLDRTSRRYVCIAEYYNPKPVEVEYRGHAGKLFKRDFAGEMLDRIPGLRLVDYGFTYHRDNNFPDDDITWFLLEKTDPVKE